VKTALQIAAVCAALAGVSGAWRFVSRRSRVAGLIFAAGLLIRTAGAAFFLATSSFALPFMTSLQMGNGFWTLASDAQEYYRLGGLVADRWQATITPGYVGPLGLWMRVVGVNPASPVLFALVMYALAVVTLVAAFGRSTTPVARRALDLGVAALSFSPMLIYAGVFGLKDVFFTALVVVFGAAYFTLIATAWTRATLGTNLLAAAAAAVALWFIAGTRAYFSILLWAAAAVTYAWCVLAGVPSRRRAVLQAAAVLPALALVIFFGAEGNYPRFVRNLVTSAPAAVIEGRAPIASGGIDELDRRRRAINDYGGNSMITRRSETPASVAVPAETTRSGRLEGLAVGLGAVFVPSSLLDRLAAVDINIGMSARLIADADTLAFDAMAVLILWVVIVNRREISLPPLLFGLGLAILVALPLGYVMTNYGTLIRLRLLVSAPLWLVTLALAPRFAVRRSANEAGPLVTRV
jgi:hypothetical protein